MGGRSCLVSISVNDHPTYRREGSKYKTSLRARLHYGKKASIRLTVYHKHSQPGDCMEVFDGSRERSCMSID